MLFGFSAADWIFIGFILLVIYGCVALSAAVQKKKKGSGEQ